MPGAISPLINLLYPHSITSIRSRLFRKPEPPRKKPNCTYPYTFLAQEMKSIAGAVGEIEGIGPGDYRIRRSGLGYIQSARLGSADVLKDGLHLEHQPEDFLEVVIGETRASVEGRVTDGTQAVSNAVVVLVPSPNLRQRSDLYYVAATDGNGQFQIQARVVPGDYKVFAWKDIEPGAWQDPEVLERYENQGQPVSVTSNSKLNIDMRLVR